MHFRILAAALLISARPHMLHACTCSNGGPRNAMRRSAAVFFGRVVSTAWRRKGPLGEIRVAVFAYEVARGRAKAKQ
jgi:hypothetical protein